MNQGTKKEQYHKHRNYLLELSLLSLIASPLVVIESNTTIAATPRARLENWRFYPESLQLAIQLSGSTQPTHFHLREPERIVIDLPDTKLGFVPMRQDYNGDIKSIRVSQLNDSVTRIVLDLAPGAFIDKNQVTLQPLSWQNPNQWVLSAGNRGYMGNYTGNSLSPNNYPNQLQQPYFPNQLPNQGNFNNFPPNYPNQIQQPNLPPQIDFNNFPPNYSNQLPQQDLPPQTDFNTFPFPLNNSSNQLQQPYFPPQTNTNNFPPNNNSSNQLQQPYFPSQQNPNNLPPINNQQPPLVTVPPLNSNPPSQPFNNILPPATFPFPGSN